MMYLLIYLIGYMLACSGVFAWAKKTGEDCSDGDIIFGAIVMPFVWPIWLPIWVLYRCWLKVIPDGSK